MLRGKQTQWLLISIVITLIVFIGVVPATLAIGEVTPTPQPLSPPATPIPTAIPNADLEQLQTELNLALQASDFDQVFDLVEQIFEIDPGNPDGLFARALANMQIGDVDKAIDDYTRYLEARNYDWTVYTLRAEAYMQQGESGEAMLDLGRAIEINPRFAQAYATRSFIQFQRGEEDPAQVNELIARGVQANSFQDLNSALNLLNDAVDLAQERELEELAFAYYNRALVHFGLGEIDKAFEDYDAAIRVRPEMQDAYMGRGYTYADQGDPVNAGRDFYQRMTLLEQERQEGAMEIGETLQVEMAFARVQAITFEANAGDEVTISARMADDSGVDPLLVLLDENGEPIAGDDDGGGQLDSQIPNFRLPQTGSYTILVSHANGGYEGVIAITIR